jgi:hypothetical protein
MPAAFDGAAHAAGFDPAGLNLVSGNFEFASLIAIEDEAFWARFGGLVAANWESEGLHQYSSHDSPLVTRLLGEQTWSNEGLFAFLQGLRRQRSAYRPVPRR